MAFLGPGLRGRRRKRGHPLARAEERGIRDGEPRSDTTFPEEGLTKQKRVY